MGWMVSKMSLLDKAVLLFNFSVKFFWKSCIYRVIILSDSCHLSLHTVTLCMCVGSWLDELH